MRKLVVLALLTTVPAFGNMNGDLLEAIHRSEKKFRQVSGYSSMAIGATLGIIPLTSSTMASSSKVLFSLAGVTVFLGGLKSVLVPSQSEELAERFAALNREGKGDARYEDTFIREVGGNARRNRHWSGGIQAVSGAVTIAAGLAQTDSFAKNFSIIMGALSLAGAASTLAFPSATEQIVEESGKGFALGVSGTGMAFAWTF